MYIYICMYIYMYVYIYICMYIYIYMLQLVEYHGDDDKTHNTARDKHTTQQ